MAGLSSDHPWAFTFGILGNIISFMVYLAPLPTFYRIYKNKSTEGFQSVPYVVALFSAMLWIYYAFIKTDAYLLVTINSIGCIIETIYILMYLSYAPKKARIFTAQILLLLNVVMFGLIVLVTLLVAKGPKRVRVLGWVCVSFSISVFIAPLSIIRLVIRTKSVEFMPFWLSFFLTISAIAWFSYGLLTKDKYVALPNILGFIFGVVQMGIYIAYRSAKKVAYHDHKVSEHIIIAIPEVGTGERNSEVHPIDVISSSSPAVHGEENADKEGQEWHEPTNDGDMENMKAQTEIEMNQLEARPMFNDRRKLPKLADPKLQGRYPMRGLYQALAVASMCIQEEAASRPLIADVVTALAYLASQAFDPNAVPNSNNRSGGERRSRCSDEKGGRMLVKNDDGESGCKWELDVDKEDSPRETIGILNRDFDRERAVAEAKMWGENWREKRRSNANAQGSFDAAS